MPRILFLMLTLLLIPTPSIAAAPNPDAALRHIKAKFKTYESQREELKKRELASASGNSSEGTQAFAYRGKSGKILIIDETYFAEMGQATWSFYYEGSKPFFVLVTETRYAYPITVTAEERKKLGGGEDKKVENRYYFAKGKLIRWLEGKKPVSPRNGRFREQAKTVLTAADAAFRNAKNTKPGSP